MASIGAVTLSVVVNVANVGVTVSYALTGSASDIASGQVYTEVCKLIGDDTGIVPAEDNIDDAIPGGTLTSTIIFFPTQVVFPNAAPINRVRTKTIPKANLNEDVGTDEIRALVTLTPQLPFAISRESNQVTGAFGCVAKSDFVLCAQHIRL
jgi:hypothetical protein